MGLYIPFSPRDTIHFIKAEPANTSEKDFTVYEGKYFSEEINSSIIIQHDSSKLTIRFNAGKVSQLIPTYKDAFTIDDLGCDLQFTRDNQNKISAVKFYFWRTRGVEFKKVK